MAPIAKAIPAAKLASGDVAREFKTEIRAAGIRDEVCVNVAKEVLPPLIASALSELEASLLQKVFVFFVFFVEPRPTSLESPSFRFIEFTRGGSRLPAHQHVSCRSRMTPCLYFPIIIMQSSIQYFFQDAIHISD